MLGLQASPAYDDGDIHVYVSNRHEGPAIAMINRHGLICAGEVGWQSRVLGLQTFPAYEDGETPPAFVMLG